MPRNPFENLSSSRMAKASIIAENCTKPLTDLTVAHWLAAQVIAGEDEDARSTFMIEAFSLTVQFLFCQFTAVCPEILKQDEEHLKDFLTRTVGESMHGHFEDGPCASMMKQLDKAIRAVDALMPHHDTNS